MMFSKDRRKQSTKDYYSDCGEIRTSFTPVQKKTSKNVFNNLTPSKFPIYSTKNVFTGLNGSPLELSSIINHNNNPITLNNLKVAFPNFENSKSSLKPLSYIRGYAANTHQGTIRNYNEDRVSIILNVTKPPSFKGDVWPKCSFFGIYDGHGGNLCADFLRDNLHQMITSDSNFPSSPVDALKKGFERAELQFITNHAIKNGELQERSGSCAIVCIIIDDMIYIANVGDSRAIMSKNSGAKCSPLSKDHKPSEESEKKRIIESGGRVYQTHTPAKNLFGMNNNLANHSNFLIGPCRVLPGRLSVSRTFGDVESKIPQFGGKPNVIIATPEISFFKITEDLDFIVLGCDGIFDMLSNEELVKAVWMTTASTHKCQTVHQQCGLAVDMIIKSCLVRRALDNVTCVLISFPNFEKCLFSSNNNPSVSTPTSNPVPNPNSNSDKRKKTEEEISSMDESKRSSFQNPPLNFQQSPMRTRSRFGSEIPTKKNIQVETEIAKSISNTQNHYDSNGEDIISYYNQIGHEASETEVHEDEEDDYHEYQRQDLVVHSGVKKKPSLNNDNKLKSSLIIEKLDSKVKAELTPVINYSSFATTENTIKKMSQDK